MCFPHLMVQRSNLYDIENGENFAIVHLPIGDGVSTSGKWKYVEFLNGSVIRGEYVKILQSVRVSCAVYIGDECVLGGLL